MQSWLDCSRRIAPLWLAAAWLMSLSTLGFFVVPMLFARLPSPAIAGAMAGQLFSVQTAISLACCLLLLVLGRAASANRAAAASVATRVPLRWVLLGALMAVLVEFVVAPHIVAHDNLRFWHSLGSSMYLLQWCCAVLVFYRLSSARALA